MICAEKRCQELGMGNVDFPPTVIIWHHCIEAWNMVIMHLRRREKKRSLGSRSQIKRQAWLYGINKPISSTIEQTIKAFTTCEEKHHQIKPFAPKHRKIFLTQRIQESKELGQGGYSY